VNRFIKRNLVMIFLLIAWSVAVVLLMGTRVMTENFFVIGMGVLFFSTVGVGIFSIWDKRWDMRP
jgi:hypothetical protein